jgi:hypothetical protein
MFENLTKHFTHYDVVLTPDRDEPEWWAGAPSVVRAPDGTFYLAARMREATAPPGQRGYEIRILKSPDGVHFEQIHRIPRAEAGVPGFERPALLIDPKTGLYRLYCCTTIKAGWSIIRFDDAPDPAQFKPNTMRVILTPPPSHGLLIEPGHKDPVIFWAEGQWHCYTIGLDRVERVWHFTSADGEKWQSDACNPVFDNAGWHNFYTRPACVLPMDVGYLFVYEGSNAQWRDPNYNIATGLAYTLDLVHITDLTPSAPLLTSVTPGLCQTWRYSCWLRVGNEIFVYAECAKPNASNEIRLFRIPR